MFSSRLVPAVVAVAAWLGLCGFTDQRGQFAVEFPADWVSPISNAEGLVESRPSDAAIPGACRANSVSLLSLSISQEEINTTYGMPLDRDTWASVLSVDGGKLQVLSDDARLVDGRLVHFVTLDFDPTVMGFEARARYVTHILPGRMVNVMCFTSKDQYEAMRPTFEAVVTSLQPR